MRSLKLASFLFIAATLLASGCSSKNAGKIEGTRWRSDAGVVNGKAVPIGVRQLEFRRDGSLTYQEGGQSSTGSYVLGSGDSITFTLKKEVSGSKSPVKKVIVEGDKLTLIKIDGTEETYSKAAEVR